MKFEKLLSSGRIGSMELKNRFVVPPMGTNFGTYEGFVTDQMIEYYRARALGGFGLIIIEVTAVDPHGKAVTILEMRADIALDEAPTPRAFLMPRLAERGIQKIVNATVKNSMRTALSMSSPARKSPSAALTRSCSPWA